MSRRQKLPAEPVVAHIESLSHEGRGVAHVDGKTVFIDGGLPGEKVSFRFSRRRARFAEGRVLEVLQASPERVEPKCRHFDICGGCSLQHMPSRDQLEHKQGVLLEQFQHIGQVEPEQLLPPLQSSAWGYRRKARLGVKYVLKKQKLLLGFREKHSNFIADLQQCEVLHPSIGHNLTGLRDLIGSLVAYDQIPQVEVAVGQNSTALILRHLVELTDADRVRLDGFQAETKYAIYLQSGGPETITPLNQRTNTNLSYRIDGFDIDIRFRPDDFTQVNFDINNAMIQRVTDMLDLQPMDRVLDLFCGLGNFSLPVASRSARVTGIEASERLVARARENAADNGIANVDFQVLNLMQEDLAAPVLMEPYNKILIDPPRNGAKEIISHLQFKQVEKLVYVSCNPATLARDAGTLVREKGLVLKQAGVLDMFPHTSHVESVALFERN